MYFPENNKFTFHKYVKDLDLKLTYKIVAQVDSYTTSGYYVMIPINNFLPEELVRKYTLKIKYNRLQDKIFEAETWKNANEKCELTEFVN
jgi:hypothetical protein